MRTKSSLYTQNLTWMQSLGGKYPSKIVRYTPEESAWIAGVLVGGCINSRATPLGVAIVSIYGPELGDNLTTTEPNCQCETAFVFYFYFCLAVLFYTYIYTHTGCATGWHMSGWVELGDLPFWGWLVFAAWMFLAQKARNSHKNIRVLIMIIRK